MALAQWSESPCNHSCYLPIPKNLPSRVSDSLTAGGGGVEDYGLGPPQDLKDGMHVSGGTTGATQTLLGG